MNKLQLYITKSFSGYKVLFNINPSEEIASGVRELRRIVGKVHYDASEKNIFYFVTNTDSGTFVVVIRTIPSAPADHLAAWIYIPDELMIDGETLENIVHTTARKVSGDRVNQTDVAELRELFGAEYPTDHDAPRMTASSSSGLLAWRTYGERVTLAELLGKGLFQQCYLDYCGVMFVDADLGIEVDGDNLSDIPVADPAVICPPEKSPEGFSANIFGNPLDSPVRGSLDANLTVVWKRPGFEDVVSNQIITESCFTPAIPETADSRKTVSAASFQITGQTANAPLEDAQIIVNGYDVTDTPHSFTQTELMSASVVVNCEGYQPYTAHIDLASSTRALIRMQERRKVYCFEMPVKSSDLGAPVRFKIFSKKTLDSSPIDGYVLLDNIVEGESRTNHLSYVRSNASLYSRLGFLAIGLIAGILIMMLAKCGSAPKANVVTDTTTLAPGATTTDANYDIANYGNDLKADAAATTSQTSTSGASSTTYTEVTSESLDYLDANKIWTREKLETLPGLAGLYDDMNNVRIDNLINVWGPKLKGSKNFELVVKHARLGRKKAKARPKFNSDDDTKITLQNYLNFIDA